MKCKETGNHGTSGSRLANSNLVLSTTNQNEKEVTTTSSPRGSLSKDHLRDRNIKPFKISLNRSYIIKISIPKKISKTLRNKLIHSTIAST